MQLICEAYQIMKTILGMKESEIADVFETWNKGVLDSFLIEITRDILRYNDVDGAPLVTKILDSAGQKGTGKWTAINALDLGRFNLILLRTDSHFAASHSLIHIVPRSHRPTSHSDRRSRLCTMLVKLERRASTRIQSFGRTSNCSFRRRQETIH